MVYIGVDLHRKTTQVAAVKGGDELLVNRKMPTSGPDILRASFRDAGIEVHMTHSLAAKTIADARVKNDAVDANRLRTAMLPEAWAAPLEVREAQCLVRMRTSLVRMRSRIRA